MERNEKIYHNLKVREQLKAIEKVITMVKEIRENTTEKKFELEVAIESLVDSKYTLMNGMFTYANENGEWVYFGLEKGVL